MDYFTACATFPYCSARSDQHRMNLRHSRSMIARGVAADHRFTRFTPRGYRGITSVMNWPWLMVRIPHGRKAILYQEVLKMADIPSHHLTMKVRIGIYPGGFCYLSLRISARNGIGRGFDSRGQPPSVLIDLFSRKRRPF